MSLRGRINKFYKRHDIASAMSRSDMHDYKALRTTYDFLCHAISQHSGDIAEYRWMLKLRYDLRPYVYHMHSPYKWQSLTVGNIVPTFIGVLDQVWYSLIHHHFLDLKWSYNKWGF